MPTITILHGDNEVLSRAELVKLVEVAKARGEVTTVDGSKSTPADLHAALGSTSLFGDERTVVIERLWSQKSPTRKKELLTLVADASISVILWHPKKVTATQMKEVSKAKPEVKEFKASMETWKLVDSLGSSDTKKILTSLHKSCEQDGAEFVFSQVVTRVRGLLLVANGGTPGGAPFTIQKMRSQARLFSQEKLFTLHQMLVEQDRRAKTSASVLSTEQFLTTLCLRFVKLTKHRQD